MTKEERENALHCLKVMIDEEVCEECRLYGATGTDHCEADSVRTAIKALEREGANKDTDFVPVEIEFLGKRSSGYLYKPQQIIVIGYITLEAFEYFGGKYKEKEGSK